MISLIPELYCDDIYCITPEIIKSHGVEAVILDIDNTLVPYEISEPTPEVRAWLTSLTDSGIKLAFVSNNEFKRVELFNRTLGYPAFPDSHKPLKRSCQSALKAMQVSASQTAIIGDQVFTDVLAGRIAGLACAFLVKPIKDKKTFFFKLKRSLEKPILRMYHKRHKQENNA